MADQAGVKSIRNILAKASSAADLSATQRQQLSAASHDLQPRPPPDRPGGPSAGPMLAGAPVAAAAPAVVGISLAALAMILIAIAAAVLLYLLWDRYRHEVHRALILLSQTLVTEVAQLRNRVRAHQRTQGNTCDPQFNTLIGALNTLARRLNSPVFKSRPADATLRALARLLEDVARAMVDYVSCIDPSDSMGLISEFLRPNGPVMRAIRRVIQAL